MSELIRQRGASSFFVRFTNKQNYFKVLTNALPVICPRRQKAHQYLSSATHKNLILDYVIKPTFYNGPAPPRVQRSGQIIGWIMSLTRKLQLLVSNCWGLFQQLDWIMPCCALTRVFSLRLQIKTRSEEKESNFAIKAWSRWHTPGSVYVILCH